MGNRPVHRSGPTPINGFTTCSRPQKHDSFNLKPVLSSRCEELNKSNLNQIPFIPSSEHACNLIIDGKVQDMPVWILLDTGAAISVVSQELWEKIPPEKRPKLRRPMHAGIKTVAGNIMHLIGSAEMNYQIGNSEYPFSAAVIPDFVFPVVLGLDFLRKFGAVINLGNEEITFNSKGVDSTPTPNRIPKVQGIDTELPATLVTKQLFDELPFSEPSLDVSKPRYEMKLPQSVILTPWEEVVVDVQLEGEPICGTMGMIQPNDYLPGKREVYSAQVLGKVSRQNTIPVRLFNLSDKVVCLDKNLAVGYFEPNQYAFLFGLQPIKFDLSEKHRLDSLLKSYRDVFAANLSELGSTSIVQHYIDTGDSPPIRQRPYRVSQDVKQEIDRQVTEMLGRGVIQPSVSPYASPVVLVKKSDNSYRFCVDYRKLNSVTKKDSFPLPRIDDTLDMLQGAKYFTTLDLMSRYWQISMEPSSVEKMAFIMYGGLYEFRVMPFGLCNAPGTFQRCMEAILHCLISKIALVYTDDVIMFSSIFEQHLSDLAKVFQRFRAANVKLKPSKCKFAQSEAIYLGHVVNASGIKPDSAKTDMIEKFPVPRRVKDVRSFLGAANYYKHFLKILLE